MGTKWKSTDKQAVKNLVTGVIAVYTVIGFGIVIMEIGRWEEYPIINIAFALGLAYLFYQLAGHTVNHTAKKYETDTGMLLKTLAKHQGRAFYGSILYMFFMFNILLWLDICPGGAITIYYYGGGILEELKVFGMQWIAWALLFGPIISYVVPLFYQSGKKQSAITAELLTQSKTREELMAELKEQTKEAVEEQIKSERMKIDLITNVSHDLKTPLTSVIGYIELMKKEDNSKTMQEYLDVLTRKTELLKKMVENVFDLAKASSGSAELELKDLELNRLVQQVLADCDEIVQEKKKQLKLDFTDESSEIKGDSVYLYRIVQNLIENALKYSLDGTRIFVRTRVYGESIALELINVSNYPIEFEADAVRERFVRGDKSRSSEGNGLGLAIVETYAAALGGNLNINIEGDTFKSVVTFPKKGSN